MKGIFIESDIAGIPLKNRIIRSATHEGLSDKEGKPTDKLIKKYEALAKGEVSAIITGYAGIMQNGKSDLHNMMMINKDNLIPYHQKLVDHIHQYNTSVILQIAHCGRQTRSDVTGLPIVAPSSIKDKFYNEEIPHELTDNEIYEIIEHFVSAIERTKKAGYDGVQLHLAHGYLLSSFLSPHMNKRKDKWGGNTINRFRIIKEILIRARKKVGDYPILVKMNGHEKSKDGLKTEEAVVIAKYLEEFGCNAIEVSCGILEEGFFCIRGDFPFDMLAKNNEQIKKIPKFLHQIVKPVLKRIMGSTEPMFLYNLSSAEQIKKSVNIPVIVVGGIRKLEDIKSIIENNRCDYISMSRPFILEPNIVMKFKEGKQSEAKCINCNYCLIGVQTQPLKCYYGKI